MQEHLYHDQIQHKKETQHEQDTIVHKLEVAKHDKKNRELIVLQLKQRQKKKEIRYPSRCNKKQKEICCKEEQNVSNEKRDD